MQCDLCVVRPPLRGGGRRPGEFCTSFAFRHFVPAAARKHKERSRHHQKFLHNLIVLEPPQRYYKNSSNNWVKIGQNQSKTIRKPHLQSFSHIFALLSSKKA
jgi:hypothetical protein